MKKLSILLAVVLCLSLVAGCSSTPEVKTEDILNNFINATEPVVTEPTVTQPPVVTEPAPQVVLACDALTMEQVGESFTLYEGDGAQFTWYSEDSSVAGVCGGVVTAVGNGTTTVHCITATQHLKCTVTCNGSFGSSREPVMKAPGYQTVDASFFDDAVFVGDSISLKLSYDTTGRLGNAQYLVQGSYGVGNAIYDVLPTSYRGNTYTNLEDAIAATGAKKLFIMMGMNDIGLYGIDGTIENWGTLLGLIRGVCPDMEIYIQSMTPVWSGGEKGGLTNPNINEYNRKLRVFAEENGCGFIDVAPFMRDATGGLATAYCSDSYVHVSEAGVDVWIKVLRAHAYE